MQQLPHSALADKIDLHCHSTASDGILSPRELVSRAKSQGVSLLALTDHDVIAGFAEARSAGQECGVHVLPGIEFSSLWGRRQVHIVGLNVDPDSAPLRAAIDERQHLRVARASAIADRLEKRGFTGALEGAKAYCSGPVLGRPHFARWMVDAGHVESMEIAFRRYLGAGKAGDVRTEWPDIEATVATIQAAGGAAVLAHPLKYGLTRTQLSRLLVSFAVAGGHALELLCGRQNPQQIQELRRLRDQVAPQLIWSLGSDFHQPGQPWRELGSVHLPVDVEPIWNLWQTTRPAGDNAAPAMDH